MPVSSQILTIDLLHMDPQLMGVDVITLCLCILHTMNNIHVTHHCITNKAQNTHCHEHIINDFITYKDWQIVAGKYEAN
jgi:hypothetical protein